MKILSSIFGLCLCLFFLYGMDDGDRYEIQKDNPSVQQQQLLLSSEIKKINFDGIVVMNGKYAIPLSREGGTGCSISYVLRDNAENVIPKCLELFIAEGWLKRNISKNGFSVEKNNIKATVYLIPDNKLGVKFDYIDGYWIKSERNSFDGVSN